MSANAELSMYNPQDEWEVVAMGTSATVYRAIRLSDNRQVAIKVRNLNSPVPARETKVLSKLFASGLDECINIIPVRHGFCSGLHLFICMDFCEGGSVETRLLNGLYEEDEPEVKRVIASTLNGLAFLHRNKIIHRDVKPGNIMYLTEDEDSPVGLVDFDLSRLVLDEPAATRVGTQGYQAPEVINADRPYTEKCDVWSVGVVTYLLLTGCLPFPTHLQERDLLDLMKEQDYDTERLTAPQRDFIARCLQPSDDRRPSAQELLGDPWLN